MRRDDYVYRMYVYREMDGSRYGKSKVEQNQRGQQAKSPVGKVLNVSNGNPDQMRSAMHHGTMFIYARTGTLYFILQEAEAFMSSEGDIYLSFYAKEPSGVGAGCTSGASTWHEHPR